MEKRGRKNLVEMGFGRLNGAFYEAVQHVSRRRITRRIMAGMLSGAMILTNVLMGVNVAYAEDNVETEKSLFAISGWDLSGAVDEAKANGEIFDFESLGLDEKTSNRLKEEYEELLGTKKGDVYELDVATDGTEAADGTDLRVFYNEGTDEVIFLYVNGSESKVEFYANIDNYQTEKVSVNPYVEKTEKETVKSGVEKGTGAGGLATESKPAETTAAESSAAESAAESKEALEESIAASEKAEENGEGESAETESSEAEPAETESTEASSETEAAPEDESKAPAEEESAPESQEESEETEVSSENETDETEPTEAETQAEETEAEVSDDETSGTTDTPEEDPADEGMLTEALSMNGVVYGLISQVTVLNTADTEIITTGEDQADENEADPEDEDTGSGEEIADQSDNENEAEESGENAPENNGSEEQPSAEDEVNSENNGEADPEDEEQGTAPEETEATTEETDAEETSAPAETEKDSEEESSAAAEGETTAAETTAPAEKESDPAETTAPAETKPAETTASTEGKTEGAADKTATVEKTDKNQKSEKDSDSEEKEILGTIKGAPVSAVTLEEGIKAAAYVVDYTKMMEQIGIVRTVDTEDAVIAVRIPDGAFEEEVDLHVVKIEDEDELAELEAKANESLEDQEPMKLLIAFDISFISKETKEEVEPAMEVGVKISLKKPIETSNVETDEEEADEDEEDNGIMKISLPGKAEEEKPFEISVVHLPDDGEAEIVATSTDKKVEEISFVTDGFSTYMLMDTFSTIGNGTLTVDGVPKEGKVEIGSGVHNVEVVGTWNGCIVINGGTVTISGAGTIDATGQNASAILVNDGHLTLNEGVTITGGSGTGVAKNGSDYAWKVSDINIGEGPDDKNYWLPNGFKEIIADSGSTCGGGILLIGNSSLTMNGGTITGNSANRGGGICAFRDAEVAIYGGSITDNTATKHEGGGIFLAAKGNRIKPENSNIVITGNTTETTSDLGGGGIFLESYGSLAIINAVVTGNTADGLGGGVAGCLHGTVSTLAPDTSAIYSNTASGTAGENEDGLGNVVDHGLPKIPWDEDIKNNAQDYFVAGGSLIGPSTLGGGMAVWEGYEKTQGMNNSTPVSTSSGDIRVIGLLSLKVTNPDSVKAAVKSAGIEHTVDISKNTSYMHGGGVGTNGLLTFGETRDSYTYSSSPIVIKATKNVTSSDNSHSQGGFTFQLKKDGKVIATATSDTNGSISFGPLSSSDLFGSGEPGTYTTELELVEVPGSERNMIYDRVARQITITADRTEGSRTTEKVGKYEITTYKISDSITAVSVEKDGATVDGGATYSENTITLNGDANFTNSVKYPVKYTPGITKKVEHITDMHGKKTYTFEMTRCKDESDSPDSPDDGVKVGETNFKKGDSMQTEVEVSATTVMPVPKSFGELTFTEPGVYTFNIKEVKGPSPSLNVEYDETEWLLTVNVAYQTEGNLGQLTVKPTYTNVRTNETNETAAAFVNTYTEPAFALPKAEKKIKLENVPEVADPKEFTFTVEPNSAFAPGSVSLEGEDGDFTKLTGSVTGEGEVNFGPQRIQFNKPGTYRFKITEDDKQYPGYTFDKTVWIWTVAVEGDFGVSDRLEAKYYGAPYYNQTESKGEWFSPTFTNTYKAGPTELPFKVTKEVIGDVPDDTTATFWFELKVDGVYSADELDVSELLKDQYLEQTFKGNAMTSGQTDFGQAIFKKAGTYEFTMHEAQGNIAGFNYDDGIWHITVEVTDGEGGKLKVASVHGERRLGEAISGAFDYTDQDAGKLNPLTITFTNRYQADITTYTPAVEKMFTEDSNQLPNRDMRFDFKLTPHSDNPKNGAVLANHVGIAQDSLLTYVAGTGEATFGEIQFTKEGTYRFDIEEIIPADEDRLPGVTYSVETWTLTIVVKDENAKLVKESVTYTNNEGETVSGEDVKATFTNEYHVAPTDYAPVVNKVISGDELLPNARDTEFTFVLEAVEGNPEGAELPNDTELTVTGASVARFGNIHFTEAGTYKFRITEKKPSGEVINGFDYDTTEWFLTVKVHDVVDGKNSKLEIDTKDFESGDITYEKSDENKDSDNVYSGDESWTVTDPDSNNKVSGKGMVTFVNTYKVGRADVALNVSKTVAGNHTPDNKEFTFNLVSLGGSALNGVVLPESRTVTVVGSGSAAFDKIEFTRAGSYDFEITEQQTGEAGYTYDQSIWLVKVEVAASEDGNYLKVVNTTYTQTMNADGEGIGNAQPSEGQTAEFTNTYKVEPTQYAPQVEKAVQGLTGSMFESDTFEFTLEADAANPEGAVLAETENSTKVTLDRPGTARFANIDFMEAGTYKFTIKETKGTNPYYTYDDGEWILTVTVEDHQNGNERILEVTDHTYTKTGAASETDSAKFNNMFQMPGDLTIGKNVMGNRGERTRDFNFTVELMKDGQALAGTYSYTGASTVEGVEAPANGVVENGHLELTLRHGQTITIHDIPSGTEYTVTEAEADEDGYRTSVEIDGQSQNDTAANGTIVSSWTASVDYLNYRNRSGGTTPGGGPSNGPGPGSSTNIPDNPTPLSDIPEGMVPLGGLEQILDDDVPLAFLAPMTGDEKPIAAVGAFALIALGLMGAFGYFGFKKKEDAD